jgi:hypothetical protein
MTETSPVVTVTLQFELTVNADDWIETFGVDPRENPQDIADYVQYNLLATTVHTRVIRTRVVRPRGSRSRQGR